MSVMGPLPYNSGFSQYPLPGSRYYEERSNPALADISGPTPLSRDTVNLSRAYDISNADVSSTESVRQTRSVEKTTKKREVDDDEAVNPTPDDTLTHFQDLNPERTHAKLGPVRGMLFDVDDTLSRFTLGGKRSIPSDLVDQLKELQDSGIRLGIVSNNPNSKTIQQLQKKLEEEGVHMDVVTNANKPNPEGLKFLQQKFGIPADQMVMVGDQFTDVEAGQNAGFKTIQVDWFQQSDKHKEMMHKLDELKLKGDKVRGIVDSGSNLEYFPALNRSETTQPKLAAAS